MQAHAEHQQHDADLGQLPRKHNISDKARGGRADHDTGGQIADQGGQLEAHGKHAENETEAECRGDGGDQGDVVGHALGLLVDGCSRTDAPV